MRKSRYSEHQIVSALKRAEEGMALKRYCHLYNHHIPQRALHHRTPIQALNGWQQSHLHLFVREERNHPGRDT